MKALADICYLWNVSCGRRYQPATIRLDGARQADRLLARHAADADAIRPSGIDGRLLDARALAPEHAGMPVA